MTDARLERWLDAVLATPGLTAISDRDEARAMLVEDALRGVEVVRELEGPIVDVGSGNGSPGIPIAVSLPERQVTLLDSSRRKAAFLERAAAGLANVDVVWGRAEEQEERFGVAVAKALAAPPVALEWLLPLVVEGGAAVLWLSASADLDGLSRVSAQLGGGAVEERNGLALVRKIAPTPAGFPRRPGMARKRPLG